MSSRTPSSPSKSLTRHIPIEWEGQDLPDLPETLPIGADIVLRAFVDAIGSGINSMAQEGSAHFQAFKEGKIDEKQFTYRMVSKASEAALKGGTRTGAALVLSEGAKRAIAKRWGEAVVRRFTRYNVLTSVAFGLVDQGTHTYKYYKGELDPKAYKVKTTENAGSTGGAIAGATAGAVLGSVIPGLGTGAGALMGYMMSVLGSIGGANLGRSLGEEWFSEKSPSDDPPRDIPIE
ncbi:MAG: hypothetical protein D6722_28630 [Bacteroidetes bacterium]|nr:MAG: hypothetical protein D6722_28630 [Bacteroidota bacterium]